MIEEDNRAYGLRRERAERLAADRAATPAARRIHNSLADCHARLAHSMDATRVEDEQ